MSIEIIPSEEYKRQFKHLYKKYKSLKDDVLDLEAELQSNPYAGTDLGGGRRKIRMAITSKGKGKSGGARVITYTIDENGEDITINLLTIYDKNEISNVSDNYLESIIKEL